MQQIEVFADVGCPFTHVGLRAVVATRAARSTAEPRLWVRAWPLEVVNDEPLTGSFLAPEVKALQKGPAPDLFAGFNATTFPTSTRPAMVSAATAYRVSLELGEAFSLSVRDAQWESGLDIADDQVLARLRAEHEVPDPTPEDAASVDADLEEGRTRGVTGSPHFFTPSGDFFCPSLDITRDDNDQMHVTFDAAGFAQFIDAVFD